MYDRLNGQSAFTCRKSYSRGYALGFTGYKDKEKNKGDKAEFS